MQLAHNNRVLADDVDSVFFMTAVENGYVSSSLVKEIACFGGDVSGMVPPAAAGGAQNPDAEFGAVSRRRLGHLERAIIRPLDIMFLLERLESQIATGTGVPRTRKVLVDKDAVLDLIDQLRVAIPEEIHAAKRINAEGERIIEKANDESTRIMAAPRSRRHS